MMRWWFMSSFNEEQASKIVGALYTTCDGDSTSGRVQKNKARKGKGKRKVKGLKNSYPTKYLKKPQPSRKEIQKDGQCHHCKERNIGKNCSLYYAELMKKKKTGGQKLHHSLGIYTIELFAFPKNSRVYDTGCGTHICNTKQGLRGAKKLKHGSLYLASTKCNKLFKSKVDLQEKTDIVRWQMKRMQNVPYASAVGSIMYAVRCTRPDVAFAQNITSRFQQNPAELQLKCYCDAGFETDRDDTKSQTGYVFVLNGGAVVWKRSQTRSIMRNMPRSFIYSASEVAKRSCLDKDYLGSCGVASLLLPQVHHEFLLWEGSSRDTKSRYNTRLSQLLTRHIYSPCVVNWDVLNRMGCDGEIDDMLRIRLPEAGSNEEIFTSVAWIRAFNINEPIYAELCHEFYSTYEFDEVCADDELQTKKIIKFRLGGRAHSLTLLEFARRLGLYQAVELDEEGFNVYFEGGLRSDEHFNAQEYWLSISREENLGLSRSHTSTIRNPILRVIHKMITYGLCQRTTRYDKIQKNNLWPLSVFDYRHQNGYANVAWLIARWMKRKGAGTQKKSQICCGQFISKIARKCRVLTEHVVRSLSALIYCRDLDTITLRDLIDSEGKLIPKDPQLGVPRVGIPRPPRASMQDLYDRMGRMEIRQEAIKRKEYRRSYH
ncbi:hypothetical protein Tco_0096847 [Tanacetum coccineum]